MPSVCIGSGTEVNPFALKKIITFCDLFRSFKFLSFRLVRNLSEEDFRPAYRIKNGLTLRVDYFSILSLCFSLRTRLEAPTVGCDFARSTAVFRIIHNFKGIYIPRPFQYTYPGDRSTKIRFYQMSTAINHVTKLCWSAADLTATGGSLSENAGG